jgi:tRNA pseudouridine38-40 synthase
MKRYKLIIEYDGSNYAGWQKQKGLPSIQETLESRIQELIKEPVQLFASGRTDAGVHAKGQVAHFESEKEVDPYKLTGALNFFLKSTNIAILEIAEAEERFHARFSAKMRYYEYLILNRNAPSILFPGKFWHIKEKLDYNLMQEGANYLLGKHDFTSFRAKDCQADSPIRTLNLVLFEKEGDIIKFTIAARSFLHHMVRNIIGTLRLVGNKKISPEQIKLILEAKDRSKAGQTAPPQGLYFLKTDY